MRFGFLAVMAASVALATGAVAQDMSSFVGNTVVITYPNGAAAKLHLKAGGAYALMMPDGTAAGGTWAIEGDQFCTTRTTPAPQPKQCRPNAARAIGDKWDEDTPQGKVHYELVAGQ